MSSTSIIWRRAAAAGLLAALGLAAIPARADWLVTSSGGRVETKGAWKVKGKLVVFTQPDGTLSSLRASEVDLVASQKATEEAKAQVTRPAPPEAPRKKLASLTDEDFKKSTPQGSTAAPKPEEGQAAPTGPVSVTSWRRGDLESGEGLEIQGSLHNNTEDMVINATVEVQLYNEAGDRVGTAPALLTSPSLQPKGTVDFRASFPGVFSFSEVKFEARGLPLDISPAPEPDAEGSNPP